MDLEIKHYVIGGTLIACCLWMKYGISRLTIWRYLGLCCRAYEAAEVERRRVMAEGASAVHGAGCVGHLVRRER